MYGIFVLISQELTDIVGSSKNKQLSHTQSCCKIVLAGIAHTKPNVIAREGSRRSDSLVCEPGSQTAAAIISTTSVCTTVPLQKALE